jgi:hypothetical protein
VTAAHREEDWDSGSTGPAGLGTVSKVGAADGEHSEVGTPWSHGFHVLPAGGASSDRTHSQVREFRPGTSATKAQYSFGVGSACRRTNDSKSSRRSTALKR